MSFIFVFALYRIPIKKCKIEWSRNISFEPHVGRQNLQGGPDLLMLYTLLTRSNICYSDCIGMNNQRQLHEQKTKGHSINIANNK